MVRATVILVGAFAVFMLGFLSLVLMLVGARLSILSWIDSGGPVLGLVIRLIMIFGGLAVVYVYRNKFER